MAECAPVAEEMRETDLSMNYTSARGGGRFQYHIFNLFRDKFPEFTKDQVKVSVAHTRRVQVFVSSLQTKKRVIPAQAGRNPAGFICPVSPQG